MPGTGRPVRPSQAPPLLARTSPRSWATSDAGDSGFSRGWSPQTLWGTEPLPRVPEPTFPLLRPLLPPGGRRSLLLLLRFCLVPGLGFKPQRSPLGRKNSKGGQSPRWQQSTRAPAAQHLDVPAKSAALGGFSQTPPGLCSLGLGLFL